MLLIRGRDEKAFYPTTRRLIPIEANTIMNTQTNDQMNNT